MRKIYFRADASTNIGYGHFTRTLALADMLKEDFDCTFFTCHPTPYQKSEMEKVCPFVILQEESHYDEFLSQLQGNEIVVLDNYFFTTDYQWAIKKKGCHLVCVDDMHNKHYVSDVVINHGQSNSALFDVEPYTRLCLGFDWALLRKPFLAKAKICESKEVKNVMVCFGGTDQLHLTDLCLEKLSQLHQLSHIHAVVGDGYTSRLKTERDNRITIYSRLSATQMAEQLKYADLVICSASSISIEAFACGTKVAAGWYVDNQKEYYNYIKKMGYIYGLDYLPATIADMKFSDMLLFSSSSHFSFDEIPFRYVDLMKSL